MRLRDRAKAIVDTLEVPQVTVAATPARVLLLAGAAGPEVKALRRWADGAGVKLTSVISAGEGLDLGDRRPPLTAAALGVLDLVVVDERSWAALGASERSALAEAVRGGLGLLLRVTGPVPATVRDQWRGLGLPVSSGETAASVRLDAPPATADAPGPPDLTRMGVDTPAPDTTPLLRDATGQVLGRWRPRGAGRLGVWTVDDSSGLVTAGFGDRYGALWSTLFSTLDRADRAAEPTLSGQAVAGRRLTVCGLRGQAELVNAHGGVTPLLTDPRTGEARCAAAWPEQGGWRTLRTADPSGGGRREQPLYIRPAGTAAGLLAHEDQAATAALASSSTEGVGPVATAPGPAVPSWAWWLAWTVIATAVWTLERAPLGRPRPA